MQYKKGERVKHPTMTDWGLGEVLEDSTGDVVRIFFVGAGEKQLSLSHVEPTRVPPGEAAHPTLDNLRVRESTSGIRYQSLPESISSFLEKFPDGFYGERFARHERDYKVQAHEQALESLGETDLRTLLAEGAHEEIVQRALKIANTTNLIFPNEKMALKDGMQTGDARRDFAIALVNLLYGKEPPEERFMSFARVLEDVDAAKWTTFTYFPFIVHPSSHIFIKPTITQHVAELCAFEINYRPQLNWLTYKQVLKLAEHLRDQLAELKPRDMIDVQSFMWCVAPGKYVGSGTA